MSGIFKRALSRRRLLTGSTALGAYIIVPRPAGAQAPPHNHDHMSSTLGLVSKPGETLRVRLANDMPPNKDALPMKISIPHQFNNTNFHFHGAHCSPGSIADNVMRSMPPGNTYDIEIELPKDHPGGTYWYHPHHHGSADIQMASGMMAAIIVEGDFEGVPAIAAARDRTLVLAEVVFDQFGMIEDFERVFRETATRF
jgi:FtsP/CotA-like multicopper oxidase with cupredoxin domain